MRWFPLLVASVAVAMLLGCNGDGKPPPGIFGKVISKGTRQPIANATVTLLQNGNEVASVETPESGTFAFPNLPPGSYTLLVTAEGYWQTQVGVTLLQGQRLTVTVEMVSEQEGPPTDVPIFQSHSGAITTFSRCSKGLRSASSIVQTVRQRKT